MIRPALPGTDTDRTYALDGLGNWSESVYTPVNGSETTDQRTHNYLNQVTEFDDGTEVLYDHGDNIASDDPDVKRRGNGNVAVDGTRRCVYDALNRLKEVYKKDASEEYTVLIATYTYDALGRRVRKIISNGGLSENLDNAMIDYIYSGDQCIEERALGGGETPLRQYVWGRYVDELIQQHEMDGGADYFLLSDLLYRSVALTDDPAEGEAEVVEAYDTDAYGNTLMYSGPGNDTLWFTDDDVITGDPLCPFIFTGRRLDPELYDTDAHAAVYFYRARYYHPQLGRFLSRDPAGYQDGMGLYQYARARVTFLRDPSGNLVWNEGAISYIMGHKTVKDLGDTPARVRPEIRASCDPRYKWKGPEPDCCFCWYDPHSPGRVVLEMQVEVAKGGDVDFILTHENQHVKDSQESFRDGSLRAPVEAFVQRHDSEEESVRITAPDEGLCKAGCFLLLNAWLDKALEPMRADIRKKGRAEDEAEKKRLEKRLERARQQEMDPQSQ